MDPFCNIIFNHGDEKPIKFKSKTHKKGGKEPVWNEEFSNYIRSDWTVFIEILDEDKDDNDFCGFVKIPANDIMGSIKHPIIEREI